MGVYINMEMPKSCRKCHISQPDGCGFICPIVTGRPVVDSLIDRRYARCPLVPVPPHGDLIDRKPFVEFIKTYWDSYDQWFVEQLEARPTIIPAEPTEEKEK